MSLRVEHLIIPAEELSELPKSSNTCDLCQLVFKTRSALRVHRIKQHRIIRNEADNAFMYKYKSNVSCFYYCPVGACQHSFDNGGGFTKHSALKQHYQSVHMPKLFPCPQCPVNFSTPALREYHLRAVCGRQFACPGCSRTFKAKKNLLQHQRRNKIMCGSSSPTQPTPVIGWRSPVANNPSQRRRRRSVATATTLSSLIPTAASNGGILTESIGIQSCQPARVDIGTGRGRGDVQEKMTVPTTTTGQQMMTLDKSCFVDLLNSVARQSFEAGVASVTTGLSSVASGSDQPMSINWYTESSVQVNLPSPPTAPCPPSGVVNCQPIWPSPPPPPSVCYIHQPMTNPGPVMPARLVLQPSSGNTQSVINCQHPSSSSLTSAHQSVYFSNRSASPAIECATQTLIALPPAPWVGINPVAPHTELASRSDNLPPPPIGYFDSARFKQGVAGGAPVDLRNNNHTTLPYHHPDPSSTNNPQYSYSSTISPSHSTSPRHIYHRRTPSNTSSSFDLSTPSLDNVDLATSPNSPSGQSTQTVSLGDQFSQWLSKNNVPLDVDLTQHIGDFPMDDLLADYAKWFAAEDADFLDDLGL